MKPSITGMHRFEAGLSVETWTSWANLTALAQLGLTGLGLLVPAAFLLCS